MLEVKIRADWLGKDFAEATHWVAEQIKRGGRAGVIQDVEGSVVGSFALGDVQRKPIADCDNPWECCLHWREQREVDDE